MLTSFLRTCLLSIVVLAAASATTIAQDAGRTRDPRALLRTAAEWRDSIRTLRIKAVHVLKYFSETDPDTSSFTLTIAVDPGDTNIGARIRIDDENFLRTYANGSGRVYTIADSSVLNLRAERATGAVQTSTGFDIAKTMALAKNPFRRALERAIDIEHLGISTFDGVACEVVRVKYADTLDVSKSATIWYFDSNGRPKRYESEVWWEGMLQRRHVSLAELIVNDVIEDAEFDLSTRAVAKVVDRGTQTIDDYLHLKVGDLAPQWELRDSKRRIVRSRDMKDRVLVVNFWGTWCFPCVKELPELQKLSNEFAKRRVEVIAMSAREGRGADPIGLFKRKRLSMNLLLEADSVARAYQVQMFPTTYIVGRDGRIADVQLGQIDDDAMIRMRRVIERLSEE